MTATDNCPLDMAPSLEVTSQPLSDKLITLDSCNLGMGSDSSQLEMICISGMDMSFMLSWPLFED